VPIGPLYLDRDDHVRDPSGNRHTLPGVTSQSPASSPTIGQNLPAPAAPV
jgi:hypothetical protein